MSANQLPENMGKKIVEALKQKTMYEDDYTSVINENNASAIIEEPSEINSSEFTFTTDSVMNDSSVSMMNTGSISSSLNVYTPDLPTNVAVLKKLVNQLPAGVSKQVGAQIIRQTMEALGISMNGVLKEAQEVHNGLSAAIQECTMKAQEHKKEILQLEGNIRDFQRQISQINDIITIFVMTDKK